MDMEFPVELKEILKLSGSKNKAIAYENQYKLAQALQTPLRQTVLPGDNNAIFTPIKLAPEASPEFPLSAIGPGEENEFIAYTNPGHGYIPQRQVEGDYIMVPTYSIANSVDWLLKFARLERTDIIQKSLKVFRWGFTKKLNDDGWRTIITAAADRNLLVYDADALQGQFTKRLVSLAKTTMKRNGGGNTFSPDAAKLTDIFMSIEGIEDIRNWGIDQIDEITRRDIFLAADGSITRIFGVNLHEMTEFGAGQEYQEFFENQIGGTLPAGDVELAIGVDLSKNDCFYMPVKQELEIYQDDNLHRWQKAGYYGWQEQGFACLDSRRVICLSY